MLALRNALFTCLIAISPCMLAANAAAEDYFEIEEIAIEGRSVAAKLAELNGDRYTDLFVVILQGTCGPGSRRPARAGRHWMRP